MTFGRTSPGYAVSALACVLVATVLVIAPSSHAQLPELFVEVGDTTAAPGATNTVISIFLSNYQDTVAGFNVWVQLDRPDIMIFQVDTQTVIDTSYWKCVTYAGPDCVDSIAGTPSDYDFTYIGPKDVVFGNFDTTGTLCSGWESVDARSLSGFGYDLNIVGVANLPAPPIKTGIGPQAGGVLVKILADVYDVPDTLTDRDVGIIVNHEFIDHFSFSRPDGSTIGLTDSVVFDTSYYVCTGWAGDVCLYWQKVSTPPADSIAIVEDTVSVINTSTVFINNGSLSVLGGVCGDIDGNGSSEANVSDLTYLVAFLFQGGPPPSPLWTGNIDCSTGDEPNVSDLTYLVAYLFQGGPAPCACP